MTCYEIINVLILSLQIIVAAVVAYFVLLQKRINTEQKEINKCIADVTLGKLLHDNLSRLTQLEADLIQRNTLDTLNEKDLIEGNILDTLNEEDTNEYIAIQSNKALIDYWLDLLSVKLKTYLQHSKDKILSEVKDEKEREVINIMLKNLEANYQRALEKVVKSIPD